MPRHRESRSPIAEARRGNGRRFAVAAPALENRQSGRVHRVEP